MDYNLILDYTIGNWGYSKQYVRSVLSSCKNKPVNVKISSLGGDLDHGLDIRQQFIDHGNVTVYLSGFVASAATVIAMGAKRIVMSKYAMFLVHKCSNYIDVWGYYNADQMQNLIAELEANKKENDKIDVVLANMYADHCGKKVSDILEILRDGRWLTAQEALDLGFIDEISDSLDVGGKVNFTPELQSKFNALGLSTVGLHCAFTPESSAPEPKKSVSKMNTLKFDAVDKILNLDHALTADADGDVCISAEQMAAVSDHITAIETASGEKDAKIAKLTSKVDALTAQVAALKEQPATDTADIEGDDTGSDEGDGITALNLFNTIKHTL